MAGEERRPGLGERIRNWSALTRADRHATEAARTESQARQGSEAHRPLTPTEQDLLDHVELEIRAARLNSLSHLTNRGHAVNYARYIGYKGSVSRNSIVTAYTKTQREARESQHKLREKGIDLRDQSASSRLGISDKEAQTTLTVPSNGALAEYLETGKWPRENIKDTLHEVAKTVGDAARVVTRTTLDIPGALDKTLTRIGGMSPEQRIAEARERGEIYSELSREVGKTAVDRTYDKLSRREELTDADLKELHEEATQRNMEDERIPHPDDTPRNDVLTPDEVAELENPESAQVINEALAKIDELTPEQVDEAYEKEHPEPGKDHDEEKEVYVVTTLEEKASVTEQVHDNSTERIEPADRESFREEADASTPEQAHFPEPEPDREEPDRSGGPSEPDK